MRPLHLGLLALPLALATQLGCTRTVGNVLADTTNTLVLPEVMALGDVGVGCASGEALGSMIAAYGDASPHAKKATVMTTLSAAMCLDGPIWDAELEGKRALQAGDVAGAKDAKAREQRLHLIAAQRYLLAHETLREAYGIPEPGEDCPKLKHREDQLSYLLGLSAGVLAVLHDLGAESRAGVPLSIPAGVVRGAACLDDDTWWGAPNAMAAAIWALQPEAPGAIDAWSTFDASVAKGKAARVRLAAAFQVQTAALVGNTAVLRSGIRDLAATVKETAPDPQWKMLDVYATELVLHESDRIWTDLAGYRTPFGALGTFPDDDRADDVQVDDGMLDDLLGD